MSAFICAECDNLRDADDGCEETPDGLRLVCAACAAEIGCAWCGSISVVTVLDGDRLCHPCANKWAHAEGQAQAEREDAEGRA